MSLRRDDGLTIPRPHPAKRQSAFTVDWSPLLHVSVRVRTLRPKGGCEQTNDSENSRHAINSLLKPFTQLHEDKRPRFARLARQTGG